MFLWFFIILSLPCRGAEEQGFVEGNLIEESILEIYGSILLREDVDNTRIYVCCRDGLITIVHLNKENNTMKTFQKRNYKKKDFPRPRVHFSPGIQVLTLKGLKKQFNSPLQLSEIRKLVVDWDMDTYKYALELMSKYINEIW